MHGREVSLKLSFLHNGNVCDCLYFIYHNSNEYELTIILLSGKDTME